MDGQSEQLPDSTKWFVEQCVRAGIKATHQRRQIYEELANSQEHPDAETVFERVQKKIPAISLDSVYRNLRTLEEHGILQRVGNSGYRARFDANMAPHHHFVCTECGLIRDFYDNRLDGFKPPDDVKKMGSIQSMHVEVRGICRDCAE